jgi:hypothetical protein
VQLAISKIGKAMAAARRHALDRRGASTVCVA